MKNSEVVKIFRDIARILEIKGDNPFRIRAYERGAQNIESLSEDIENLLNQDRLGEVPGIGFDLSRKIKEFIETGKILAYEDLKKSIPQGLLELLNIPSVGPKTAKLLYEKLRIKNLPDLEKAIEKKKLTGIFGIKEKTIENIVKGIEIIKKGKERMTLGEALMVAQDFLKPISKMPEVKNISTAGSLRRRKDTVRDIDLLVVSDEPGKIMGKFTKLPPIKDILAEGATKASVRTKDDIQVDCRVVVEKSFGAALLYFTGSKNFNIKIRLMALKKGLKINEYGVFRKEKYVAGKSEQEIFKLLGISFIEPEMREDAGEIELAKSFKLPNLIELDDLKGDLHVHSEYSDGSNSIEEVAYACRKIGYSYVAITDHSQSLKVAGGLSIADLNNKKKEINMLNKKLKNFRILFATEVDIDSQGNIDYKDSVLKEFDLVIAAIHSGFKQSKQQLTKRIINACKNKYVHIIAHPTGRLWGTRDAYEIDFEEILKVAKDTNTHFEINSFPERLDLNDHHARLAKEKGVKLAINTDSHSMGQLLSMHLGVSVARRGWLTREDVINTLSFDSLLKELKK